MVLQRHRRAGVAANYQYLLRAQGFQCFFQPRHPWIEVEPAVVLVGQLRVQCILQLQLCVGIGIRLLQGVAVQVSRGKALDCGTGIAEQHTAGAVAIKQLLYKRLGVLCLETEVGRLNTDLVNRYLSVKTRELV